MKKLIVLFLFISVNFSCAQEKLPLLGDTEHQKEMNAKFKDALKSPLTEKDRKSFRSLDFFKFDSTYVVTADFMRTPDEEEFTMKTTTDRLPVYVKYGEITFNIEGKDLKLNVYQNVESVKQLGEEESLFLPFLDHTNGEESYGGGRYINVGLPENNQMVVDFNTAYNPYCAYNPRYSCPIVPRENYLPIKIKAGVKMYDKH